MGKKILLIDDEPDFTELVATLLGFHNLEVKVYNDSVQIEKILQEKTYDLIVTDLMMPHVDGFEIVRKLRGNESYKEVPIIVLSAKSLSDEERKFLLQNNVHFLTKPFEPQGLVDKITQLL